MAALKDILDMVLLICIEYKKFLKKIVATERLS